MSHSMQVSNYFSKAALVFDSLYSEKDMNPFMKFINKKFRSDIYERYLRTIDHVRINDYKSLLDVGCGSGRYELGLAELNLDRITGVDFSQEMIDLANSYKTSQMPDARNIDFICADFLNFEPSQKYDVVFAMGVFDYIIDPVSALKRMKGWANHSVVVSFPSFSFYRTPLRKFRYILKECPVFFYDEKMLVGYAKSAGFSKHDIQKIKGAGMDYFAVYYI